MATLATASSNAIPTKVQHSTIGFNGLIRHSIYHFQSVYCWLYIMEWRVFIEQCFIVNNALTVGPPWRVYMLPGQWNIVAQCYALLWWTIHIYICIYILHYTFAWYIALILEHTLYLHYVYYLLTYLIYLYNICTFMHMCAYV